MKCLAAVMLLLFVTSGYGESGRIATWNLGGFNRIPQSNINKIVQGLKKLDADIVVLPELNPLSHANNIAEKLSEPLDRCYKAEALDQKRARQEIGFVFKCDVTLTNSAFVMGSDLDKQGYRSAVVVNAKIGEFDFVLIGLHLKAGRGKSNRLLRDHQLAFVSGYIQGVLQGDEKDVLVIGDYNMIPGKDASNFSTLNSDGSLKFVSSEDLVGQGSHISGKGNGARIGNLLDGYGFSNVDEPEYRNGSIEIIQMHDELGLSLGTYKDKVTDHLPVLAEFETEIDND